MEEKKPIKISLTGCLLVIALIIIGIMSYFTFKFYNEKAIESKKVGELNDEISGLKTTLEDVQEKMDTISNVVNESDTKNSNKNIISTNSAKVEDTTVKEQNNNKLEKIQLTQTELSNIESFLNEFEVNGFIAMNIYKKISDIDLEMVFYRGSQNDNSMSQKELEAYLKASNSEGLEVDLSRVKTSTIQEIYKKYTGANISKEEIKKRLNWVYVEEYDTFYMPHGDTNYIEVNCISGYKNSNNEYFVTVKIPGGTYYNNEEYDTTTLTLKKNGDSYIFVSNILSK